MAKTLKRTPKRKADLVARDEAAAVALGMGYRTYLILKAIDSTGARMTCKEIAAASGVGAQHLAGQMWYREGVIWGAGKKSLGYLGLIRRYDDKETGEYRVGLTAKGEKLLKSLPAKLAELKAKSKAAE